MFGTSETVLHGLSPTLSQLAVSLASSVSQGRLRKDVEALIGPHNRLHLSDKMREAEDLIFSRFQEAGWEVKRRPFSINKAKGNLDYGQFSPITYPELSGVNITAEKPGVETNETLVIEAHYDTVRISPGADDNTASVAALLELARILKPYPIKKTLMLAACDMEEIGFIGATHLVNELKDERKVQGAIILETLAYTSNQMNTQSTPSGFGWVYPKQMKRLKNRGFTGEGAVVIYHKNGKALAVKFAEGMVTSGGPQAAMLLRGPADIPFIGWILRVAFLPL